MSVVELPALTSVATALRAPISAILEMKPHRADDDDDEMGDGQRKGDNYHSYR